jgi:hypothetical protein
VTTTIQDEYGTWLVIGESQLDYYKWVKVGDFHDVTSGTYRLTFQCSDFSLLNSFAWIRAVHAIGGNEIVSSASRIYPKKESLRIELPIPHNFQALQIKQQRIEVMKVWRRWKNTDKLWTLKIEELVMKDESPSQNTFLLDLDNPSYARDPERPELWVTTFTQDVPYGRYEVGRYYDSTSNQVIGDPITDAQPYRLIAIFTANRPISPSEYNVRIVY